MKKARRNRHRRDLIKPSKLRGTVKLRQVTSN